MNGQVSCEGPLGKTSLFDVEALTSVDPATLFRKDDLTPKVPAVTALAPFGTVLHAPRRVCIHAVAPH